MHAFLCMGERLVHNGPSYQIYGISAVTETTLQHTHIHSFRQISHLQKMMMIFLNRSPTSGRADVPSKLVDGRCRVQFLVALVDLTVRSFSCFTPKLVKIRARIPQKGPYGGHPTHSPRSLVSAIELIYQHQSTPCTEFHETLCLVAPRLVSI